MSRKNRGLRLHTFGMRLAFSDFYDSEKCVRVIFYAVRVSYDTLCGWTKFFISASLTDEKFLRVANPG